MEHIARLPSGAGVRGLALQAALGAREAGGKGEVVGRVALEAGWGVGGGAAEARGRAGEALVAGEGEVVRWLALQANWEIGDYFAG